MREFISETDVERALSYLRDNADAAAKARAERIYVEEFRKVIKAQIMKEVAFESIPISAQEREAYADDRYIAHLDALREAVYQDEKHRFLLEAAKARIDSWRTQCATERAMKL